MFLPEILSEERFNRYFNHPYRRFMRFSTHISSLWINSRGKYISWNCPKSKSHLFEYHSEKYPNVDVRISTKFEILNIEGDDFSGAYVYFCMNYGYRAKKDEYWQNYPPDEKIFGRMEMLEFDGIVENPDVWIEFCKNAILEDDKQKNNIITQN